MLVSYKPAWPQILKSVGPSLIAVLVVAISATAFDWYTRDLAILAIPDLPLSLIGALLGILLGFRTNSAYGRWWEARSLWGSIVNDSRNWARQVIAFTPSTGEVTLKRAESFRRQMIYYQIAFVHALRRHLRGEDPLQDLSQFMGDNEQLDKLRAEKNVPLAIIQQMATRLAAAVSEGMLSDFRFVALDATLCRMIEYQGGSERIKNTPFPRQYDYYPEFVARVYCYLFPLAICHKIGLATPLLTLLVALALLLVNEIGKELESPFDDLVHGMPLNAICRTIEINLRQQLGEIQLPAPIAPVNGVLP
jgi:putative membrane protein